MLKTPDGLAQRIKGLNTELPLEMNPTAQTIVMLYNLERQGVARFDGDDGPDSHETVNQLDQICGNVGYNMRRDGEGECVIFDQSKIVVVEP